MTILPHNKLFLLLIFLNVYLINGHAFDSSECKILLNEFLTGKLELYDIIQNKLSNYIITACNLKTVNQSITLMYHKGIQLLTMLLKEYNQFLNGITVNECSYGFCGTINECPSLSEGLLTENYNIKNISICGMNPLKVCCLNSSNPITNFNFDVKQITKLIFDKKHKEFLLINAPACLYQKNLPGTCSQIQNCPYFLNEYKNGNLQEENLIFCQSDNEIASICCPNYKNTGFLDTNVTYFMEIMSLLPKLPKKYSRISQRVCSKYLSKRLNIDDVQRIMETDNGYVPHLGALYTVNKTKICSCFLIHENFLLTAAHCIKPDLAYIALGLSDTRHYKTYSIQEIVIHEDYNQKYTYNDIALIKVNESVAINLFVKPACLNSNNEMPDINSKLFIAGWENPADIIFRIIDLRMSPLRQCNTTYLQQMRNHKISIDERGLDQSILCARDPLFSEANQNELLNDACTGDSGGPLQGEANKFLYIVYGIIAHGLPCGLTIPGLYTRISYYVDWIEKHVWPNAV